MSPCGIRIHNLSSRVAAELRLRPRGQWDRQEVNNTLVDKLITNNLSVYYVLIYS